jgi:hypothetical protein
MTVTLENLVQEGIGSRLIDGDACHHSVQNPLPPRLKNKFQTSETLKIKLFFILSLYLTLSDEYRRGCVVG